MKKILLAVVLVVVLMLAFAAPVLADQPDEPGIFGEMVIDAAQNEVGPGASPEIDYGKVAAGLEDMTFGQFLRIMVHEPLGIPPNHTP